jgi:hypothetical protein
MSLLYAQARPKRQLHLIEVCDSSLLSRFEQGGNALCGRGPTRSDGVWRMTINVPLGHACKDCLRKLDRS